MRWRCFDVIETVDREKIARAIAAQVHRSRAGMSTTFVQVNTGLETQKAGIAPADTALA